MKIERTRNAMRNVIFGTIQKLYMLIVPFVTEDDNDLCFRSRISGT